MSETNENREEKQPEGESEQPVEAGVPSEGTIDFAKLSKAQLKEIAEELVKENETLQFANDALNAKYQKAEKIAAQANDVNTLYQRLQVDFDNYRKRNADIVEKSKDDAEAMIVAKFLPVYDNILRALQNIKDGTLKKGDVLAVAQVAGIQAAKHNWELIPMCHPLPLTGIDITFALSDSPCMVEIQAAVTCTGVTGVEMEALTAVSVAALTIYDMCKAVQKDMRIENIRLLSKSGGKSGDYQIKE